MKKLIIILLLFVPIIVMGQEKKIYEYENGIRSLSPTHSIVEEDDKTYIYEYDDNGLRDLFPDRVIEDGKVYDVDENGLRDLFPSAEIDD